jgi:hypothetical protein
MQETSMHFIPAKLARAVTSVLAASALLGAVEASAGGVITTGLTSLGVNDSGELNFFGDGPGGSLLYGVYRHGAGDAISPGCACEGWGVAVTLGDLSQTSAFANQSSGSGGYEGGTFGVGALGNTATSTVRMSGAAITIRHAYGPSLQADTFQAQVTISNTGSSAVSDLVYRRAMDWDVPPTEFWEYVTHGGVVANLEANGGNVRFASNNGFASSDPLSSPGSIETNIDTVNADFDKAGPDDHGSVFDFAFGSLAAGESRVFNIYYGSAANEAQARSKIAALGANVFSIGQPSGLSNGGGEGEGGGDVPSAPGDEIVSTTSVDPAVSELPAFFFAFGGVGGSELGSSQTNPILPFVPAPDTFVFDAPQPRRWYDPPMVEGFTITLTGGGEFLEVMAPDGFTDLELIVDGVVVEDDLDGGDSFHFAPGVTSFKIVGIHPLLDAGAPGFGSAFPLFLDFTNPDGTTMTWTAINAPVPEPAEWALILLSIPLLGWQVRRKRAA